MKKINYIGLYEIDEIIAEKLIKQLPSFNNGFAFLYEIPNIDESDYPELDNYLISNYGLKEKDEILIHFIW